MFAAPFLLAVLAQTAPAAAPPPAEAGPALPPNTAQASGQGWLPLFNGQNLDGWYTFRQAEGKNNDPLHIFKVEDGAIHVLDVDPAKSQPNGYLATNEEFRNYRVRLEYKWGTIKLPVPRHPDGLPRDAGLLYHMVGPDAVWPTCVEFQIQEHDTGDVWLLPNQPRPNPTANTTALAGPDGQPFLVQPNARGNFTYQEGGLPVVDQGGRIYHSAQYDAMDGWNTVELFATENNAVHVVNGHVNNAFTNLQLPNNGGPLAQGKILLQAENNEVFYRKVEIKPLFADRYGGLAYKVLMYANPGPAVQTASPPTDEELGQQLQALAPQFNFTIEKTNDPKVFTDEKLRQYRAVIFLNYPGALDATERAACEHFVQAGGGVVGLRLSAAYRDDWDWFGKLLGTTPMKAMWQGRASITLEDTNHAATASLPLTWQHDQIWPYLAASPRADVHVLAKIDQVQISDRSLLNTAGPEDLPVAWCHDFDGGRAFYSMIGPELNFAHGPLDPLIAWHLLGGIMYAAGTDGSPPPGATVLFDGKDTSHWVGKDNATFTWRFHDGVIEPPPPTFPNGVRVMTGDLHTKETYTDFQLHVEFKVPGTKSPETRNAETNEQARGNSGVYLQGRYETQILDSFDHPLEGKNDEGAIYEVKDGLVNAALPAEVWQAYDITFHAARWQDGKKIANARATIYLNGVLVQDNTEIPGPTRASMLTDDGPTPGPIALQDHLNTVQFRLVWIKPLAGN